MNKKFERPETVGAAVMVAPGKLEFQEVPYPDHLEPGPQGALFGGAPLGRGRDSHLLAFCRRGLGVLLSGVVSHGIRCSLAGRWQPGLIS